MNELYLIICLQAVYDKSESRLGQRGLETQVQLREAGSSTIISLWGQKLNQINASQQVSIRLREILKADT